MPDDRFDQLELVSLVASRNVKKKGGASFKQALEEL